MGRSRYVCYSSENVRTHTSTSDLFVHNMYVIFVCEPAYTFTYLNTYKYLYFSIITINESYHFTLLYEQPVYEGIKVYPILT